MASQSPAMRSTIVTSLQKVRKLFSVSRNSNENRERRKNIDDFSELIGAIVHGCGTLESLTNQAIKNLGTDSLLASEIITLSFRRRIRILRDLLCERKKLAAQHVDSLCNDLYEIANLRNKVAHNPIAEDIDNAKSCILVVRNKFDPPQVEKLTEADLQKLLKQIKNATNRLVDSLTWA
jgi:hypothetical protein